MANKAEGISRFAGRADAKAKAIGKVAGRTKDAALATAQAHEERVEETGLTPNRSASYATIKSNPLKPSKQGLGGLPPPLTRN